LSPYHLEQIRRKMAAWMPELKLSARIVCTGGVCDSPTPAEH